MMATKTTKHDFEKLNKESFQTLMDMSVIMSEKFADILYDKAVKIAAERHIGKQIVQYEHFVTSDDIMVAGRQMIQELQG